MIAGVFIYCSLMNCSARCRPLLGPRGGAGAFIKRYRETAFGRSLFALGYLQISVSIRKQTT